MVQRSKQPSAGLRPSGKKGFPGFRHTATVRQNV